MSHIGSLEKYFEPFRENVIGREQTFESPFGTKKIIYADWTASGRGYWPIESRLLDQVIPFFANTHTETTVTGTLMTQAYEEAKRTIRKHVNASEDDALIFCGSGMTAAVNKLQRLLGMRVPDQWLHDRHFRGLANPGSEASRPVVFITSMEHHSNHISWLETVATVEIIQLTPEGLVDLDHFESLLDEYCHRKIKIAAVTACSNVTGIQTPYHQIAGIIHAHGGYCFVDFAGAAPYVSINMHPQEEGTHLDAIYFSMHKFLGGPGTPGVLVFNKKLYNNPVPDQPGGGTILYTNPWRAREYVTDVEAREDGGTPPVLQGIKAAMCIRLKEAMGVENILQREQELLRLALDRFSAMANVTLLQGNITERLGILSFLVHSAHYNLIVKLLNDRFGVQARGGCSCAGTYGHRLLHVNRAWSQKICDAILAGDLSAKPGWIRVSLHPTMTNQEVEHIMDAIEATAIHFSEWEQDYSYDPNTNEFTFRQMSEMRRHWAEELFDAAHYAGEDVQARSTSL